jgi:hypothetical protein
MLTMWSESRSESMGVSKNASSSEHVGEKKHITTTQAK